MKKVYVKNKAVSVLNYAWHQEDVWDKGGTTPRFPYLGHYIWR